jgi:inorganic pyrophosphatase
VRVEGWGGVDQARKEIMDSLALFKDAPERPNF